MERRKLDIVIISDVHLGTYECHAQELLKYLKSIAPENLILNGDFIDFARLKRKGFTKEHLKVIKEVVKMAASGTKVYYITGNRDDRLRQFSEFSSGVFSLRDKLVLKLGGKKIWIFHGDLFDASLKISPFLTKFGGWGYDSLLLINRWINKWRKRFGKARMSFSQKVKKSMKKAIYAINTFENTAINLAAKQGYDYVVCGHIHQPVIKSAVVKDQEVVYMNSGDWVENLTALEYANNAWSIYKYDELDYTFKNPRLHVRDNKKPKENSRKWNHSRQEQLFEKILDSNLKENQQTNKTKYGTSDIR